MFISHLSLALIRPTYPAIGFQQDFTNTAAALPANITFTASTTRNRFNSAGTLTSTAIDVARANANQDYNPSTLAARGFLIEAGATNLILQSQTFDNATWVKSNSTVTANSAIAPDGTLTADTIVRVGTANSNVQQTDTRSAVQYTASVYAKAGAQNFLAIQINTNGTTRASFITFNLTNGAIGTEQTLTTNVGLTAVAEDVGNGWYRCSVAYTSLGGSDNFLLNPASAANTRNGDDGGTIFTWGAQFETGPFASSYIATTTAAVPRGIDSGDILSLPTINYSAAQGFLVVRAMFEGVGSSSTRRVLSFNDGSTDNEIAIVMADGGSDLIRFLVTTGAAGQADISTTITAVANTLYAIAVTWGPNGFKAACNGTGGTPATGTIPTVTRLSFGKDGAGANSQNGWQQLAQYGPQELTQAQINAMTA